MKFVRKYWRYLLDPSMRDFNSYMIQGLFYMSSIGTLGAWALWNWWQTLIAYFVARVLHVTFWIAWVPQRIKQEKM